MEDGMIVEEDLSANPVLIWHYPQKMSNKLSIYSRAKFDEQDWKDFLPKDHETEWHDRQQWKIITKTFTSIIKEFYLTCTWLAHKMVWHDTDLPIND